MVLFVIIILLLIYGEKAVVDFVVSAQWLAVPAIVLRHVSQLSVFLLTEILPDDKVHTGFINITA